MQSATQTHSRAITVAAGPYAAGHVGELTQVIPFELVDAVLAECGATEQRLRDLPSRVGVYLVVAMGLFEHVGLELVYSKLLAGLAGITVARPSEKALRDLRRRVGVAPVRALFHVLAGFLAQPAMPGARYRGLRTVAFDGCSSIKVPDHGRNRTWLGKIKYRMGLAGYPALMLMALAETGTRGLIGAVFGPVKAGERAYAAQLLPLLGEGMLLLDDRGFDGNDFLRQIAATKAQFLVRAKSSRRPPVLAVLADGSYLTRIAGLKLRVIEARITVTGADGSLVTDTYRLITTLLDHRLDPAPALVRLYHERWEIESAFLALRHTMLAGRVLRSKDPVGIEQELWAILCAYQALRIVMVDAAASRAGTDPDRCGFTIALEAARDSVILAENVAGHDVPLVGRIGQAVLGDLLPTRRARYSARKVKSPISRYHARTEHARPLTSAAITAIDIEIQQPAAPPTRASTKKTTTHTTKRATAKRPRPNTGPRQPAPTGPKKTTNTAKANAGTRPATHRRQALDLIAAVPGAPQRARDLAATLGITGAKALNSFCVQLSQLANAGLLTKTAPATYMTSTPSGLTANQNP
jgi:hypothetical protein